MSLLPHSCAPFFLLDVPDVTDSEWFMAVGALQGYEHANGRALDLCQSTYPNALLLALTDTFSTEVFFKDFTKERAERWSSEPERAGLWLGSSESSAPSGKPAALVSRTIFSRSRSRACILSARSMSSCASGVGSGAASVDTLVAEV